MKASAVAAVVASLLATDAKPTESAILAAILAADKKARDGLGPEEIEKTDKAKDKKAKDEKDDPEGTNDADMDDMSEDADCDEPKGKDKKAKDADVQPTKSAEGNSGSGGDVPAKDTAFIVRAAIDARDALHAARRDVEPVLGIVTYDSAADVYRAALVKLGVAVDGIDPSAFPALFKLARDRADAQAPTLASDAATVRSMAGVIKGYDRLK